MATVYKFGLKMWQDQAGDEDAKINVFVNDSQIITEQAITATSAESPQIVSWESEGLGDPSNGKTVTIKVVLANDYYVDSTTDRNAWISDIYAIDRFSADAGYTFKIIGSPDDGAPVEMVSLAANDTASDKPFMACLNTVPTSITANSLPDGWYTGSMQYTPILGGDSGLTIVYPLENPTNSNAATPYVS